MPPASLSRDPSPGAQEALAAAELEALRKSDPVNYPPPTPAPPEPKPQPEPWPEAVFITPDSMYPEVAEAVDLMGLYATVPVLSAEELRARRRRYRCGVLVDVSSNWMDFDWMTVWM